jgi:zinc transport system substrate-binding protein
MRHLLTAALILLATPALATPPKVVATIKPIHSLVAAVMGDIGSPILLVEGTASPHGYSLAPGDHAALKDADIVFWTGHGMELFFQDALPTLAPEAKAVDLSQSRGMMLYRLRKIGPFSPSGDDGPSVNEAPIPDFHYWLDPQNAIGMVQRITETLVAADPDNADIYGRNAAAVIDGMFVLLNEIRPKLDHFRNHGFLLLHDGTQYFEMRFQLDYPGLLTLSPEDLAKPERLATLRARIVDHRAVCVFSDPLTAPETVAKLVEGTPAKVGMLDPEALNLDPGPGLYRKMLHTLADSYVACLGGS